MLDDDVNQCPAEGRCEVYDPPESDDPCGEPGEYYAVWVDSILVGTLLCEQHQGSIRYWTPDDEQPANVDDGGFLCGPTCDHGMGHCDGPPANLEVSKEMPTHRMSLDELRAERIARDAEVARLTKGDPRDD